MTSDIPTVYNKTCSSCERRIYWNQLPGTERDDLLAQVCCRECDPEAWKQQHDL